MAISGSQKFAVFLCSFADDAAQPHASDFYRQLIVERGTGGLNDYWIAASQSAINLDGSEIFGWRALQQKKADFLNANPGRSDKINAARAAFPEVDAAKYSGIIAMYNSDVGDGGNAGNGVLASPTGMSVTFLAHETGHVFGLEHSFDQSDRKDISWSAPGEYFDMHDIMSAMNVHSNWDEKFQQRGPLLCSANLDRMGWLNPSRVRAPSHANSSWSDVFDLVSMSHPEIPGYLAAKVGDLYIEYRTDDLWDSGLPRPGVLLHVMSDPNAVVIASDKAQHVNDWQPGQMHGPSDLQMAFQGGVQIRIVSFDPNGKKARINVRVVAQRPIVSGPGSVFGGVAVDGGGWLILDGRVVRIPPRTPFVALEGAAVSREVSEAVLGALSRSGVGRIVG